MQWVFLSYSGSEREEVMEVSRTLRACGYAVWDYRVESETDIHPASRIADALDASTHFVVVVPRDGWTTWMLWELARARTKRCAVIELTRGERRLASADVCIPFSDSLALVRAIDGPPFDLDQERLNRLRTVHTDRTRWNARLLWASGILGFTSGVICDSCPYAAQGGVGWWSRFAAVTILGVPANIALPFAVALVLMLMLTTTGVTLQMTTSGRPLYRGQRWSWVLPSCGILFLVGAGAFQLAACHAVGELKIATALLIGAALFSFVHDGVPEARRLGILDS